MRLDANAIQATAGKAGRGKAWRGAAWQGTAGMAWRGLARLGGAGHGRQGSAGQGMAGLGRHGPARLGSAWQGKAGKARPGMAGQGPARPGKARLGEARQARRGKARLGPAGQARPGSARRGTARHGKAGTARQGAAGHGWARQARRGSARHGTARLGRAGKARRGSKKTPAAATCGGKRSRKDSQHEPSYTDSSTAGEAHDLVGRHPTCRHHSAEEGCPVTATTAREVWVAACKRLSFTAADRLPRLANLNPDGRLDVLVARITEAAHAWKKYQKASSAEAEASTISTADAARKLGKSTAAVVELLRCGELSGYADTTPSGRVHRWRVYRESIDRYEARRAAGSPLNRARKGWAA